MQERMDQKEITWSVVIRCMRTVVHDTGSGNFLVRRTEANRMQSEP